LYPSTKSCIKVIILTLIVRNYPESVGLQSSVKTSLGPGPRPGLTEDSRTRLPTRVAGIHFPQDDKPKTTMNKSRRLVELDLTQVILCNTVQGLDTIMYAFPP